MSDIERAADAIERLAKEGDPEANRIMALAFTSALIEDDLDYLENNVPLMPVFDGEGNFVDGRPAFHDRIRKLHERCWEGLHREGERLIRRLMRRGSR